MSNRLASETSPYLLQHKDNPVDWRPWDDDALDEALRRDQPILLSIGYAACHWCHVMEHESFEDDATAELMNESFVCIKVDREERPDLDAVYMDAVQAMTGHGGWPMTVFLTPEGVPFYGGTYFPPEDRHGLPSFKKLLIAISDAWRDKRSDIEAQGKHLIEQMDSFHAVKPSRDPITPSVLTEARAGLEKSFDPVNGGFGSAPKFPQPMTIDLLMRFASRGDDGPRSMVVTTLDAMAAGGMYDQLRGGFARYSVDERWLVPHFEKMLYDNAQLLRTYARSWQLTKSARHREVAEATVAWMLDEMRDKDGGFWSSLDADSEGVEGKFYVWTIDEVRDVTGADFEAASRLWGFSEAGNFEGSNIPVWTGQIDDEAAIERARAALLERRSERVRPGTDSKVLTAWNGLAAAALAEAGTILGRQGWVETAAESMRFVLKELRQDGRLMRSYRDGVVKHLGFAEDYAFCLEACLSLYEATHDEMWLGEARWCADEAIRLFLDTDEGGFFTNGSDGERLITRSKDLIDNAVPAANSVFALELQRLSLITGQTSYAKHATDIMLLLAPAATRSPLGFAHLLGAIDLHTSEVLEIVIIGSPEAADTQALLEVVRRHHRPDQVLVVADDGSGIDIPLLQGRGKIDGRATAYVCRNMTCKQPADSPEALEEQLSR
jgi:uncharacterized protein YyaL (SSP411 family)